MLYNLAALHPLQTQGTKWVAVLVALKCDVGRGYIKYMMIVQLVNFRESIAHSGWRMWLLYNLRKAIL